MTTATLHRPPTEAEIRAAVEKVAAHAIENLDLPATVAGDVDRLLWDTDDLRPSERDRLDELEEEAFDRIRDRMTAALVKELAPAMLLFAQEHPEAPRR